MSEPLLSDTSIPKLRLRSLHANFRYESNRELSFKRVQKMAEEKSGKGLPVWKEFDFILRIQEQIIAYCWQSIHSTKIKPR